MINQLLKNIIINQKFMLKIERACIKILNGYNNEVLGHSVQVVLLKNAHCTIFWQIVHTVLLSIYSHGTISIECV